MKRILSIVFVLFLSVFIDQASAAFTASMALAERDSSVNRTERIICFDVVLSNSNTIKEMNWNVAVLLNGASVKAQAIPAYMIGSGGGNDKTKWSKAGKIADNQSWFRYWIDQDSAHNFLPASTVGRPIMTFYVIFEKNFPDTGYVDVSFTDIKISYLNGAGENTGYTANTAIRIFLGKEPDPNIDDSVHVQISGAADKAVHKVKLFAGYKSPYDLSSLSFKMKLPSDLSAPEAILSNDVGKDVTVTKQGDVYFVLVTTDNNNPLPAVEQFLTFLALHMAYPTQASGFREITFSAWQAKGLLGETLKISGPQAIAIDLGEVQKTPSVNISVKTSTNRNLYDSFVDLYYQGDLFSILKFYLSLPKGVWLKRVESQVGSSGGVMQDSTAPGVRRLTFYFNPAVPKSSTPKIFYRLVLGFEKTITGVKEFNLYNLQAWQDPKEIEVNKSVVFNIDFGKEKDTIIPDPGCDVVKFSLAKASNWFYLGDNDYDANGRYGTITLDWIMDNIDEVIGAMDFNLSLPYYIVIDKISAINLNSSTDYSKIIKYELISSANGRNIYKLAYYADQYENSLLPNPKSQNPRTIIKLKLRFYDLKPGTETFNINNLTASALDGKKINNVTKDFSISIDFLRDVYPRFRKGDLNIQFGDTKLTKADLDELRRLLIDPSGLTLYKAWAADLNGDGKIDSYDETILQNLIDNALIVEENIDQLDPVEIVELYNFSGQRITIPYDLRSLPAGVYFYRDASGRKHKICSF